MFPNQYSTFFNLASQNTTNPNNEEKEPVVPTLYRSISCPDDMFPSSSPSTTSSLDQPTIYRSIDYNETSEENVDIPSSLAMPPFTSFPSYDSYLPRPSLSKTMHLNMNNMSEEEEGNDMSGLAMPSLHSKNSKELALNEGLSSLSLSTSSQQSSQDLVPPPVPAYYERFSSFFSRSAPDSLIRAITSSLENSKNTDFSMDANTKKIRGVVYTPSYGGVGCTFQIQIYSMPLDENEEEQKYLCECQRRNGCVVIFKNFYQSLINSLSNHVCDTVSSIIPPLPLSSVPLSVSKNSKNNNNNDDVTLTDSCYSSLISMMMSEDTATVKQSLSTLSSICRSAKNKKFVSSSSSTPSSPSRFSKLLRVLSTCIHSLDKEVVLSCVSLLCHLSSISSQNNNNRDSDRIKKSIMDSFLAPFVRLLSLSVTLIDKEIRRQVSACLCNLSSTPSSALSLRKQMDTVSLSSSLLNSLSATADPRVRAPITTLMKNTFIN